MEQLYKVYWGCYHFCGWGHIISIEDEEGMRKFAETMMHDVFRIDRVFTDIPDDRYMTIYELNNMPCCSASSTSASGQKSNSD